MGVNRIGLNSLVRIDGRFFKVTRLRYMVNGLWITITRLGFSPDSFEYGIGYLGQLEDRGRLEVL